MRALDTAACVVGGASAAANTASASDNVHLDGIVRKALDLSYHDKAGGWDSTGVRWWIKYHLARGEDPCAVADPTAPLAEKLNDEWRLMRFTAWLCAEKKPPVSPDTAAGYASTVQGWLERNFGVRVGGGLDLQRRAQLLKGIKRMQGGQKPKRKRKALTPQKLQMALKFLDANDPAQANVRAALTVMTQGLLRGGEAVQGDRRRAWKADENLTRGDISIGPRSMQLMIIAEKDMETLGAKVTPIVVGRARRGAFFDAVAEMENLCRVDPVPRHKEESTPAFRNPKTGRALKVSDMNKWVKHLMACIGEDPADYGSHSCRIGGATALYADGCSELDIRTMGRWASDVYLIYVHADRERTISNTQRIASAVCRPTEDAFDEDSDED